MGALFGRSSNECVRYGVFLFRGVPISACEGACVVRFLALRLNVPLPFSIEERRHVDRSHLCERAFKGELACERSRTGQLVVFVVRRNDYVKLRMEGPFLGCGFLVNEGARDSVRSHRRISPIDRQAKHGVFKAVYQGSASVASARSRQPFAAAFDEEISSERLVLIFAKQSPHFLPL